jgi:hypothetical protein
MKIKAFHVTFEQAKLLKEKGFDEKCLFYYLDNKLIQVIPYEDDIWCQNSKMPESYISAPEHWQVVEWLLQNHRLDIIIKYPESNNNKVEGINSVYYDLEIYRLQGGDAYKLYKFIGISDKKQEAYSKAFDYIILKELI